MPARESTYYDRLGVKPSASPDQIRLAYRRLAKTTHPDAGGTEAAMAALTEAYQTLSDPIARLDYDRELAGPPPGESPSYHAEPAYHAGTESQRPGSFSSQPAAYRPSKEQNLAIRQYVWHYLREYGWQTLLGGALLTWLSFQPFFGESGWGIGLLGAALLYWPVLQISYLAWPELKLTNYRTARAPHRAGRHALRTLLISSLLWLPLGLIVQGAVRLVRIIF